MLVIKAYINTKQIDEIHIQNKGGNLVGLCDYEIVKPDIPGKIRHNRPSGWIPLAATVLQALAEAGYANTSEEGQ
jgi:hypothetical protein